MAPFSIDEKPKYTEKDFDDGRKKKNKVRQLVREANRRLKKSKRQELKRELRNIGYNE